MSSNTITSSLRHPRGIVRVNGELFTGWLEWEVENNIYYQADTFRVVFAIGALPSGRDADWFTTQQSLRIEIFGGIPPDPTNYTSADLTQWIAGFADEVEINFASQEMYLHGRDYTALLIDAQTIENWVNQTSSTIVNKVAGIFNLSTVDSNGKSTISETKTKVGDFVEISTSHLTTGKSYWDLLTYLANREQFIIYVSGNNLYFQPPVDSLSEPYVLQWNTDPFSFNGMHVTASRNMVLANNIQVVVKSFHRGIGQTVTAIYPATVPSGAKLIRRKFSSLTQEAATMKAKAIYQQMMQHEVKLEAELPADDLLTTAQSIKLAGTAFDQIFYPSEVTRRMNVHDGYTMKLKAKNISPQNQQTRV
jgi:hypothetical protein